MKHFYAFLFLSLVSIGFINSQDYFPLEYNRYWVYNVIEDGKVIGTDSSIIDSFYNDGTYDLYRLHDIYDTGTVTEEFNELYDHPDSSNDIHSKTLNGYKITQHSYQPGDSWEVSGTYLGSSFSFTFYADSVGQVTVPLGTYQDCYHVYDEAEQINVIYAPDVGPIQYLDNGVVVRELIRKGIHVPTGFSQVGANKPGLRIYSGPADSDFFWVERSNVHTEEVFVYNMLGSLVKKTAVNGKKDKILLNGVQKGIYIAIVGSVSEKIIVR